MVKLIPEEVRQSWPEPNLVDPPTRGNLLLIISLCFTIVTILVVSGRFYVRLGILRTLYVDDFFIAIAFAFNIGLCVAVSHAQYVGWDRHQWDQREEWFETSELHMWVIQLLFVIIMTFAKLSSLFLYRRVICATSNEAYKKFVLVTIGVVIGWGIGFFAATLFSCWPVQMYWQSRTGEECGDEGIRLLTATIINVITDFVVVLMPVGAIFKMNRALREKIILMVLISLGLVASVASIVRGATMAAALEDNDDTCKFTIRRPDSSSLTSNPRGGRSRLRLDRGRVQPRHHLHQRAGAAAAGPALHPPDQLQQHRVPRHRHRRQHAAGLAPVRAQGSRPAARLLRRVRARPGAGERAPQVERPRRRERAGAGAAARCPTELLAETLIECWERSFFCFDDLHHGVPAVSVGVRSQRGSSWRAFLRWEYHPGDSSSPETDPIRAVDETAPPINALSDLATGTHMCVWVRTMEKEMDERGRRSALRG